MSRTILFLCPHNAAKSVMASALCARDAAEGGLDVKVSSAGTEPDPGPAPPVVALLAAEGIDVAGHRPRKVTEQDLSRAWRIVNMGCELSWCAAGQAPIEQWQDVPAPSKDLEGARERIGELVAGLLDDIRAKG